MLKTVYSNAYEILEAYLTAEMAEDKKKGANPFERVRIISSSSAVNNRLRQHLAKENSICSGIDFWTTESWFHNYAGIGVGEPDEAQDFVWVIWSVLTDDFINRFDRLKTYFSHRIGAKEKALARYELAQKIASVFDKYVNYRFDWVANWMGLDQVDSKALYGKDVELSIKKEKKALEAQPDFAWQKAIWEKLAQTTVWVGRETLKLYARPESLQIKFANEPRTLHFFAPMGISPLMLPVIKMLSESGHQVYVYLINPCVEYWFESGFDDSKNEKALTYLRKNAASTRAMINRFWTFTPEGHEDSDHKPAQLPNLVHAPIQRLPIWTQSETERLDLIINDGSLLHQVQKAIVENSSDEIPEVFDLNDRSVRLIKAPTLTREVQNAINMIQALFGDKSQGLKPEDILIVTPEIDKTAPVFEACMQALPDDFRMDYQIMGQPQIDTDKSAQSLIDLGALIMQELSLPKLNAWLELPLVGQSLGLSLDELNILHDWLLAAGFRNAINIEHYRYTHPQADDITLEEAADGTLERAIERLAWGYVYQEGNEACPKDILPIQHGSDRFATIAENESLFLKLCRLSEKLEESFRTMTGLGDEALPTDLSLWAHGLIDRFFTDSADQFSLMSLRTSLRAHEWALTTVPEPITMPLSVYWRALSDRIAQPTDRNPAVGRITLASMQTFRALPFRVIIALGLGEESGFPGNQRFEEFDLMGVDELKRQNDRDSRSDNRNVFLDLFLSARDFFICSYSVGTDKKVPLNPSPVVVDWLDLLTLNAKSEGKETVLQAKARLTKSITAEITLTDTAEDNFKTEGARYWKSFMQSTLDALVSAKTSGYQDTEPVMLTGPLASHLLSETLYLEDLISFYKDPTAWVQRKIDFKLYETELAETVPLTTPKDSLSQVILRRSLSEDFAQGESIRSIEKRIQCDPSKGTPAVRLLSCAGELAVAQSIQSIKEMIESKATATVQSLSHSLANQTRFGELIAEDIKLYRFNTQASEDEASWLKALDQNAFYLVSECDSGSALNRIFVRAAILSYLGLAAKIIVLDSTEAQHIKVFDSVQSERASVFVESLIEMMGKQIERACFIASKGEYNKMEKVLWRGRDYETVKTLSETFFDKAIQLIAPEILFPAPKRRKKDQTENKMQDFESSLKNLLAGEAL